MRVNRERSSFSGERRFLRQGFYLVNSLHFVHLPHLVHECHCTVGMLTGSIIVMYDLFMPGRDRNLSCDVNSVSEHTGPAATDVSFSLCLIIIDVFLQRKICPERLF